RATECGTGRGDSRSQYELRLSVGGTVGDPLKAKGCRHSRLAFRAALDSLRASRLLAETDTRIGQRDAGVFQLAMILVGIAIDAADRLLLARAVPSLRFAKPGMQYAYAVSLCLAGVAVGLRIRSTHRDVHAGTGPDVARAQRETL